MKRFIKRLNHADVIIPPGGEAQARAFYCDLLGFNEIPKPGDQQKGGLWLQLNDVQIHLSVQKGYDPKTSKAHLGYEVTDLSALGALLLTKGVLLTEAAPGQGFIRAHVRDPFGNRIEFLQEIPPEE